MRSATISLLRRMTNAKMFILFLFGSAFLFRFQLRDMEIYYMYIFPLCERFNVCLLRLDVAVCACICKIIWLWDIFHCAMDCSVCFSFGLWIRWLQMIASLCKYRSVFVVGKLFDPMIYPLHNASQWPRRISKSRPSLYSVVMYF